LSSQTIQFIGLLLDFIGALILAIPLLKSKKEIQKESGTYFGMNLYLSKAMLRDRILGVLGLIFFILGFGLQMLAMLV